ncbi:hypothetical protein IWX90DRAFT_414500 [Phyllosticta citrichinensis]|uniref:Uncharacterized protein n=1 Tax=Phyllosticta citrichinensis TaxID=1130410 RepID=A0ABR1XXJ1_9PEZI
MPLSALANKPARPLSALLSLPGNSRLASPGGLVTTIYDLRCSNAGHSTEKRVVFVLRAAAEADLLDHYFLSLLTPFRLATRLYVFLFFGSSQSALLLLLPAFSAACTRLLALRLG